MNQTVLRHASSEFIGTFALVAGVGGATMVAYSNNGSILDIAVASGLAIAIFSSLFLSIAAHFNPALTIGLLFTRRIGPALAGVHIAAQFAGGIAAAFLLKALYPEAIVGPTRVGGTIISVNVPGVTAWGLELLAGFFLMVVYYGSVIDKNAPRLGGIPLGLAVTLNTLMMAPLTGASMNPARSLGPAMASGIYEGLIIFFTAPVVGAIIAALAYEYLFIDRDQAPAG